MTRSDIPFAAPLIGDAEISAVAATLQSDWLTTGPRTREFERAFRAYVNAPATLAVSSGTAAIHLGLAACGIDAGHTVITTPMTFCSTVRAIEQCGATPLLVDVERDTLNIDVLRVVKEVERRHGAATGSRVAAVLPVHYAGHPVDLDPLLDIADDHDLALVEDAAHALPATYRERPIGAVPDSSARHAVAFSFYATKNLTTGEGGMLTGSPSLIDEARIRSLHGMSRSAWRRYETDAPWYYEVVRPGFKYNMTDIAAALGLQQLRRITDFARRRETIARRYTDAFADHPALEVPVHRAGTTHAWHLYVLRLHTAKLTLSRDEFITQMSARGIGTSVHFIPIHLHPYFADRYDLHPSDFPIALEEYQRCVSLPLYPRMTDDDTARVIEAVLEIVDTHHR